MNKKKHSNLSNRGLSLTVGVPVTGFLKADKEICYTLDLAIEEAAFITLEVNGLRGTLTISATDGIRLRGREIDSDGTYSLAFVADTASEYRVQLRTTPGSGTGSYTLMLDKVLSLEERLRAISNPRLEGTCIKQLRADLSTKPSQTLAAFWQEVEKVGTPFLESDPLNPKLTLCTFLWRGKEETRNVRVHLLFRTTLPNEYAMVRLEGTDVWYTTIQLPSQGRFAYTLLVNTPFMSPPHIDSTPEQKLMYFASSQADPLNPRCCFEEQGSRYEAMSQLVLPDAPPQPWTDERPQVSRGTLERYSFKSEVLNDERFVSVYTPPGYSKKGKPNGLLFIFDEQWYLTRIPTATILDNLLADQKIPPLVAVVIGNGPGDARSRQLPCNPLFADFMAKELMPWVHRQYNVSGEPRRTIVAGASYGGLAAAYVALRYPEVFGNVLSQSGSFWWRPPENKEQFHTNPYREPNYLASLFIGSPRLQLRFYMDAGSGELDLMGNGRSILSANRHLRDVLLAKGYEVYYREFIGGHDFLSWRGTFADGLILLTSSRK